MWHTGLRKTEIIRTFVPEISETLKTKTTMKTMTDKWLRRAFAALLGGMLVACSGEETNPQVPEEPEPPTQTETPGEVSFSIGNGTTGAPNVVSGAGTTDMTISQCSTYHDPDGTTFTCEPKASVKVSAAQDTLCAKDLKALLSMTQRSGAPGKTTTGSVTTTKSVQTFDVGGQEITFDLAYETYTYVNSQDKTVEMPYVKVNAAQYGAADTEEKTRSAGGPTAVTAIRLTPIGDQTRGTLTDSAVYRVSVSFTVGLESVHTKSAQAETLSVEVEYIGIVETTTEYPDPTVDFSYTLSVLGGTASQASPFEVRRGETLALQWDESSRYTYFSIEELSQQAILCEPKVRVELSAAVDTVFVDSRDELEKVAVGEPNAGLSAENLSTVTNQAAIAIGAQTLTLVWSYDTVDDITVDGGSVAMPYLTLGGPEVVSVSISEPQDVKIDGTDAKVYEVTARLRQALVGVNTEQPVSEAVEYIVKYVAVQKIKLVKVTYKRDWEWVEPHDNMPLLYFAKVHRTRHYSNGESFTDTFMDYGHQVRTSYVIVDGQPDKSRDGEIYFYPGKKETVMENDSVRIYKRTSSIIAPPDAPLFLDVDNSYEDWFGEGKIGDWELYETIGYSYDEQNLTLDDDVIIEGDIGVPIPEQLKNRRSCWYFTFFTYLHSRIACLYLQQEGKPTYIGWASQTEVRDCRYDQYLLLDGRMITFTDKDIRPDPEFDYKIETTPEGWQITHEMRLQYMGRNFYVKLLETILLNP